jgi:purine-nucleoside phosphorylase
LAHENPTISPAEAAAAIIREKYPVSLYEAAIIVSDIFASVAIDLGEKIVTLPYAALPGFPVCEGVERGEVVGITINGCAVLVLSGRTTFYETGDPSLMASAMETLAILGVRAVMCMGVAQSVHPEIMPGSAVLVTDHINLTGLNPLIGAYAGGRSRITMYDAYDKRLRRRMKAVSANGANLREGVLMWFSGPSYETPAEVKMARLLGADLVGWTIATEAILARRFDLSFLGLAVVTNFASGVHDRIPDQDVSTGPALAGVVATKRLLRSFFRA